LKNNIIPYGRQNITDDDINAVISTLKSDFLTQGPKIDEFEKCFASYIGSNYAVAVSNGTAALHLSVLSLDIKKGDKVITTPITFSASANCVKYCGGEIVFTDIDPNTYLIDIQKLEHLLKSSPKNTFKGLIPVNFAGRPCDFERLKSLCDEYGLWIVEDSCHSPGGFFFDAKGNKYNCGDGMFSNLSIFSFHPVKHIACGEGGMITTNDEKLYNKLLNLRTHGITKDTDSFNNSIEESGGKNTYPNWYMEMQSLGFNYRLTDIQAALGISQLKRAKKGLEKRNKIAEIYYDNFKNKKYILGQSGYIEGHAYHLYIIEVENRLELYNYLRENKIFAQIHYFPCHLMPYYKNLGWKYGDMPNSEKYYSNCISLPMYPELEEDQHFVIKKIISFYE
jgi:UDP-4-amino-4,6-dideoxy-N-acetyl-beta-L-altrosamine transaminase